MKRATKLAEDPPLTEQELIALRFVGGRVTNEPSHALPQRQYHDPAHFVTTDALKPK